MNRSTIDIAYRVALNRESQITLFLEQEWIFKTNDSENE